MVLRPIHPALHRVLLVLLCGAVICAEEDTATGSTASTVNAADRRAAIVAEIAQFASADHVMVSRSDGHGGNDDRTATPADSRQLLLDICAMMRAPEGTKIPEETTHLAIFAYAANGHFISVIGVSFENNYYEMAETGMVCMPDGAFSAKVADDIRHLYAPDPSHSSSSATSALP